MDNYKELIKQMTFEEKAALLTGGAALTTGSCERLNIPSLELSDGPNGVRRLVGHPSCPQECAIDGGDVCYPSAAAVGATWNTELAHETGAAIGRDCIAEGIDVILAPGINMKRTPRCGRNFEYYSEDPVLSGLMGAAFINGVQSEGVGTSLKHFAVNNQEADRGSINAEVDERTLREYYLKEFEVTLKNSNPTSVMCAYNKLNGIWCSENKYLLNDLLKEEWGYDGLVISDWGAVHDINKALRAGLDFEMPKNKNIQQQLQDGLDKGIITMEDIDRALESVLKFTFTVKGMERKGGVYDRAKQHEIAYKTASEAITLLKNDNEILPITKEKYKKVGIIGKTADFPSFMGGGSSCVSIKRESVDRPLDFIKQYAGDDIEISYLEDYGYGVDFMDNNGMGDVASFSAKQDLVIVFLSDNFGMGEAEAEELDRLLLSFTNYMNYTVEVAAKNCKNVVAVMQSGSAVIPHRWHELIGGIIQMWYAGEAAGRAIADILFGKVNPSGKLSETFMLKDRTDIDFPGDWVKLRYKEGLDVAYHYYDLHKDEIWYPFGHGLSYTTFEYSDLKLDKTECDSENTQINVSFKVKNTGNVKGKEVTQLYIAPLDNVVYRPIKELKHFTKTELEPGEEKTLNFTLTNEDFDYFNLCMRKWHTESGEYDILIGASSQDIRLKETVFLHSDNDYTKVIRRGAMVL